MTVAEGLAADIESIFASDAPSDGEAAKIVQTSGDDIDGDADEAIATINADDENRADSSPKAEDKVPHAEEIDKDNPLAVQFQAEQKELIKLQIELEAATEANKNINDDDFYDNLSEILSEEVKELKYLDEKKYFKELTKAKDAWIKQQQKDTAVLQHKYLTLQTHSNITGAVIKMTEQFPDYNHEVISNFVKRELSEEQREAMLSSVSAGDFFGQMKKAYEMFSKKKGLKIEKKNAPKIPNLIDKRGHGVDDQIDLDKQSKDKAYEEEIGFRKL